MTLLLVLVALAALIASCWALDSTAGSEAIVIAMVLLMVPIGVAHYLFGWRWVLAGVLLLSAVASVVERLSPPDPFMSAVEARVKAENEAKLGFDEALTSQDERTHGGPDRGGGTT